MAKKNDESRRDDAESTGKTGDESVKTGGWDDSTVKVRSRDFPGPSGASEALRIAMTKDAYAGLIGHAKESLDREICGVLLGYLCEDEHGFFVTVEATIRGAAAKTGGTHVTFTQETWNAIHKEKEEHFRKLQIVGWYHSHPGFGVEFSDMDMFIQKNFFSGPSQIAFVSDPLGGEEAICANTDSGIKNIRRFWVDGRERRCYTPKEEAGSDSAEGEKDGSSKKSGGASGEVVTMIHELEDRVRQLTDAAEKQRNTFYNFLTFIGMLTVFCLIAATAYSVYRSYRAPLEVPQDLQDKGALVPMEINGKTCLIGIKAVAWKVPDELDTVLISKKDLIAIQDKLSQLEAAATQAAATQAATQASTQPGANTVATTSPTTQPTSH